MRAKIWVVGDVMIDRYIEGDITRMSPEAPVPIVRVTSQYDVPGGAANVAKQIAAYGLECYLGGTMHYDDIIKCPGVNMSAVIGVGKPTIIKTRITSRGHHVVRYDIEDCAPINDLVVFDIVNSLKDACPRPNVVIISDYCKGTVTPLLIESIIAYAQTIGAPVLVDTKSRDIAIFQGATGFTPNLKEAELMTGLIVDDATDKEQLQAVGSLIRFYGKCDWVIITLGDKGLFLSDKDGLRELLPASETRAIDVTGAGDTVIATIATQLAVGNTIINAAKMANVAAGLAVTKSGTVSITGEELLGKVWRSKDLDINLQLNLWRAMGKKIVFTNGCFDILHAGHLNLFRKAKALGDVLVVGINTDESVRLNKGKGRPYLPLEERIKHLEMVEGINLILPFEQETPLDLITLIKPDVLVKGRDYEGQVLVGQDVVEGYGGRVVLLERLLEQGIPASTTELVDLERKYI